MRPQYLTLALATVEAIKKGAHRDPHRLTRYLLKHQYEAALKIFKEIPYISPHSENNLFWNSTSYFLRSVLDVLRPARLKEQEKLAKNLFDKAVEDEDMWVKHPDLAHEKFASYVKQEPGLDWWDLSPEEILKGIRKMEEQNLYQEERYSHIPADILQRSRSSSSRRWCLGNTRDRTTRYTGTCTGYSGTSYLRRLSQATGGLG